MHTALIPVTQRLLRIAAILVLAVGIVLVALHREAINPGVIRDSIASHPMTPLIFIALQVAASLLFIPRTALGITAGLLFGFAWGLVWSMVGAIAGAAAGLAVARWIGGQNVISRWPHITPLVNRVEHGGWRAVAILRLAPVPHSVANTALAITKVSWRDYLVGSALGMAPMTVAQVQIGASGNLALRGEGNWLLACLVLAGGLLLSLFLKRMPVVSGSGALPQQGSEAGPVDPEHHPDTKIPPAGI
ncbi:MAG: TVP38/TMEM64 family protein [Alphaproteobacteria bacterium]|nr:TVP38/TMEM64 family protein [Alphaproteobacteria bacterium]